TSGRFTQRDPIGLAGGDTNQYRFALNSPIDLADPTGLKPHSFTFGSDETDHFESSLHESKTNAEIGKETALEYGKAAVSIARDELGVHAVNAKYPGISPVSKVVGLIKGTVEL